MINYLEKKLGGCKKCCRPSVCGPLHVLIIDREAWEITQQAQLVDNWWKTRDTSSS